jgi:methylmalonyl-CoA mutase
MSRKDLQHISLQKNVKSEKPLANRTFKTAEDIDVKSTYS